MFKPSWKAFFEILSAVVVFVVPIILYLMEKAGIDLKWIFILGWISIAIAALYLVLNVPWIWANVPTALRIWRISFVSLLALLVVSYGAIRIWPSAPTTASERKKQSEYEAKPVAPPSLPSTEPLPKTAARKFPRVEVKKESPKRPANEEDTSRQPKGDPVPAILAKDGAKWTSTDDTVVTNGQAIRIQDHAQVVSERLKILRPETIDPVTAAARIDELINEKVQDEEAWKKKVMDFLAQYQPSFYHAPIPWPAQVMFAKSVEDKKKVLQEMREWLRSNQPN